MKITTFVIAVMLTGCGSGGGEDSESTSTSSNSSLSSEVSCVFVVPENQPVEAGEATDENIEKALKAGDSFFIANCGSGEVSYDEDNSVTTTTTTTETNSDVEIQ